MTQLIRVMGGVVAAAALCGGSLLMAQTNGAPPTLTFAFELRAQVAEPMESARYRTAAGGSSRSWAAR